MKHYETALPEGYEMVCFIDAKVKKTGLWMNAIALLIFVAALAPFVLDLLLWLRTAPSCCLRTASA